MLGGTLEDTSVAVLALDFESTSKIAQDVCAGCCYLHQAQPPVVVRLAPCRVALDGFMNAKVSVPLRQLDGGDPPVSSLDLWTAPEVLQGEPCSCASDAYAFGLLLFELFSREEPFKEQSLHMRLSSILHGIAEFDLRPVFPKGKVAKPLRELAVRIPPRDPTLMRMPTTHTTLPVPHRPCSLLLTGGHS